MKRKEFDLNENQVRDIFKLRQEIRYEDVNTSECFNPDFENLSKNSEDTNELKASVNQIGLLQPIIWQKLNSIENHKLFNWRLSQVWRIHFVKELNIKTIFLK